MPDLLSQEAQQELLAFAQDLVRIKSYSGQEEEVIRFIERKMIALGYDEVTIDAMGNLVGRIGSGEKCILLDAHVDTVEVNDEAEWAVTNSDLSFLRAGRTPAGCAFFARMQTRHVYCDGMNYHSTSVGCSESRTNPFRRGSLSCPATNDPF